jgi:hypothetical protein
MNTRQDEYQSVPFPKLRRALAMMYHSLQRVHKIHGLIEVDVTAARPVSTCGSTQRKPGNC